MKLVYFKIIHVISNSKYYHILYVKLVFDSPCTTQGLWNPFIPLRQLSSLTTLAKYINYSYFKNIPDNINVWSSQSARTVFISSLLLEPSLWAILSMEFPRVVVFSVIFLMMNSLSDCLKKTLSSLHFWSTFSAIKIFQLASYFITLGKS